MILYSYDYPLPPLPKSLRDLQIELPYKHPVNAGDTSLEHLGVDTYTLLIPQSLSSMAVTIGENFQLPPSINTLSLLKSSFIPLNIAWSNVTCLTLGNVKDVDSLIWPPNLIFLEIYELEEIPLNHLPSTLTTLIIGSEFNQPIDNLPRSLCDLTLGDDFDQNIDNLPPFLIHLHLGDSFSHSINNLPQSLRYLTVGDAYNHPIDNLPSLNTLTIGSSFNQEVPFLPSSLFCLSLPLPSLPCGVLPNSIASLDITPILSDNEYSLFLPFNLHHFNIRTKNIDISFNFVSWKMTIKHTYS